MSLLSRGLILCPAHTAAMNTTILAEVTAAGCVLYQVAKQIVRRILFRE